MKLSVIYWTQLLLPKIFVPRVLRLTTRCFLHPTGFARMHSILPHQSTVYGLIVLGLSDWNVRKCWES